MTDNSAVTLSSVMLDRHHGEEDPQAPRMPLHLFIYLHLAMPGC